MRKILGQYDLWIALFVVAVLIPALNYFGVISNSSLSTYGKYMSLTVAAIGVDLIWGYTGILSLCQAMFFCMGAYAMGMYLSFQGQLDPNGHGVPYCLFYVNSDVKGALVPWFWEPFRYFPLALILGITIPACVACVFGFFAFRSRVKGVYLSIITQAITLAAVQFFMLNNMKLGGTNGVRLIEVKELAGMNFYKSSGIVSMYLLSVLAVVGVYLVSRHLVNSRLGRILIAIRDNESRLRFSGYHPAYYKIFIFAFAAAIAGIGGMLYIPQVGIITPTDMDAMPSILMVVWVALGGRGTLTGPVVGALAVNFLYSNLTSYRPKEWPFVLGAIAITVVLYFPEGLVGLWRRVLGTNAEPPHPGAGLSEKVLAVKHEPNVPEEIKA